MMKLLMLGLYVFLLQTFGNPVKLRPHELQVTLDTIKIGRNTIYINKPLTSKKSVLHYEEGIFITYTLPDSSYIVIQQGSMINSPITKFNKNELYFHKVTGNLETYQGMRNNKTFFREDIYNDRIHLIYESVKPCNKVVFDEILNKIRIN
jgi:hypothetical protein